MKATVKNLQKKIKIRFIPITRIVRKIDSPAKFSKLNIALYFIKDGLIKRLNRKFFGKDCLTDVISFYLGKDYAEIFIAPSVVKNNASIYKTEFKEELYRCIIHGVLHIFGYRDDTKIKKIRMWKRQEYLLKKIV